MPDKCVNHPDSDSSVSCSDCGSHICPECEVVWHGRKLCTGCARDAMTLAAVSGRKQAATLQVQDRPAKSKLITFILSFCPGVGHWYLGLEVRGLYFISVFFGLIAVTVLTGQGLLGLILGPLWLYSISDSMWAFDELVYGDPNPDRAPAAFQVAGLMEDGRRRLVGIVLLVVGVFSVINNLPDSIIPDWLGNSVSVGNWMRSNLLGVLLIGIGVWLIAKFKKGTDSGVDGGGQL